MLELGTLLPTSSRLSRWLAAMHQGIVPRFNRLGEKLGAEIGKLRGAQAGAPWAQVQYLPPADQLCLEGFHVMCDRLLVALLPGVQAGAPLQLFQARHMAWQRQVRADSQT